MGISPIFLPDEVAEAGENALFNHTHNPALTGSPHCLKVI